MSAQSEAGDARVSRTSFPRLTFPKRKFEPVVLLPTFNADKGSECKNKCQALPSCLPVDNLVPFSANNMAELASDERVEFLRMRCAEFLHADSKSAILGSLPRLLRSASTQERIVLVDELMAARRSGPRNHLVAAILRESNDLEQLKMIVAGVGAQRLMQSRSPSVREFVAWATVGARVQQMVIPAELSKYSGSRSIERRRIELIEVCSAAERVLESSGKFGRSELAKQYRHIISELRSELGDPRLTDCSSRRGVEQLNLIRQRLNIGLRYALLLSEDPSRSWRARDLEDIREVFERLPQGKILFTPRLFEIRRVEQDDPDTQGERHEDGLIRILDIAIDDQLQQVRNHGISSLQSVLTHELGHALQLGASAYRMRFSRQQLQFVGMSDPSYDFGHYMQLSGWAIVAPEHYKIAYFGDALIIDDQLLPLDTPLLYNGAAVEFRFDPEDEILYAVNPFARYSLGSYAKTNPWEDWAEAFCEYVLLPQRLASVACDKFDYFNQQFGLYES